MKSGLVYRTPGVGLNVGRDYPRFGADLKAQPTDPAQTNQHLVPHNRDIAPHAGMCYLGLHDVAQRCGRIEPNETRALRQASMAIYSTITRHRSYLRALALAGAYLKNPQHLRTLIERAQLKSESGYSGYLARIRRGLGIPVRMLNAYITGEYRDIPWRSLSMITAAVVYFVMPFDLLPDILPLFGFFDDVALLTWTVAQIKSDIDRFLDWEQRQLVANEDIIEVDPHRPALPNPEALRDL